MSGLLLQQTLTFEEWRNLARPLLLAGVEPDIACRSLAGEAAPPSLPTASIGPLMLSAALMSMLEGLACFRAAGRYELMYRLAWRVLFENPRLLEDAADADVRNAMRMDASVRRDVHKMHAFVRFREMLDDEGEPRYFAWFEPDHDILRLGSTFFVKRFPNMKWTIATPHGAAVWNKTAVNFLAAPHADARPLSDAHEQLWRTYYRSVCNAARVNVPAMLREMPKKYWKNLPEAADIGLLVRAARPDGPQRARTAPRRTQALSQTAQRTLADRAPASDGPEECRRCDLWQRATQAVLGRGPRDARIVVVGEQPGDAEDLQGLPFVGPAGRLLDEAIAEAGLVRAELYLTNAVKHFKWEPRGKRRLHKRPDLWEVDACNVWLNKEIAEINPRMIVALGATALRALAGWPSSIEAARHQVLRHASGALIVATYHPAAVLRAEGDRAVLLRAALVEDLVRAGRSRRLRALRANGGPIP